MGDNIKEEVGKTTRTLTDRNTLILNQKGELSLVFLKLNNNDVEDYWLDFEDSEDISEDEKVLFQIPIVYPQNVTQDNKSFDNPLENNLENITIFENNKFYIDQLNDCLYNSSNSEINDIQVSAQMYIKLPEFFTIRIEIKEKARRIFLGFVTLEKDAWSIDIVNDGKKIKYATFEGPSEFISSPVFHKGSVISLIGQDPEHGEGVGRMFTPLG